MENIRSSSRGCRTSDDRMTALLANINIDLDAESNAVWPQRL
jgi:hypothetical protein